MHFSLLVRSQLSEKDVDSCSMRDDINAISAETKIGP
jgi:hypothetical protein